MSSQKRKRSSSAFSSTSRASSQHVLPRDTINPHSYSEGVIKQLHVAGLADNDLLPANYIAGFPHRPIGPSCPTPDDDDDDRDSRASDEDGASTDGDHASATMPGTEPGPSGRSRDRARRARAMRDAQDRKLGVLTAVVLRALEEGDVPRARRAFGLLRRGEVRGKPVDLRRNGLWALGAEVVMREGEEKSRGVARVVSGQAAQPDGGGGGGGDDDLSLPDEGRAGWGRGGSGERDAVVVRRWGSAANMPRLRAYLEGLIRQYPYNRLHPDSTSDLDFYPVLFGCEFYDCWVEHKLARERLDQEAEAWSDDMDMDMDMDMGRMLRHPEDYDDQDHPAPPRLTSRERRLRQEKARLGRRALDMMRDLAARMDALLENAPYNRSPEMLRLRGMAALYVGDLVLPPAPRTEEDGDGDEGAGEARRARGEERARARVLFAKMRENGGAVDPFTEEWLGDAGDDDDGSDEDDDTEPAWSSLPVFSSLPMR